MMQIGKGIERHSWKTIRSRVMEVHPKLVSIIDNLSPSKDYSLYTAKYPYGSLILDRGVFQLVNSQNQLVPLSDFSISTIIQEELGYNNTMPTGLISQNSIETFFIAKDRTIPASLYGEGNIVSLWSVLEENNSYQVGPLWSISSGARTICMLPKITDKNCYRILKTKFNQKLPVPRALSDHWHIFEYLANHPLFEETWSSEIIFFSKKWFSHKHESAWSTLYQYFLNDVWQSSSFKRNQFIFDFAFSIAQENRNLKPNPYLADTIRHLIAVGSGSIPALTIAIDNLSAPIRGLQKIFIEHYGLKKYAPVIMHLHHFSNIGNRPVYYSLEMPTTTVFSPRSSRLSSKMVDMRELKHLLEVLFSEILKGNLYVEKTPLFELVKNIDYHFFHSEKDQLNEVLHTLELTNIDKSFTKSLVSSKESLIPESSPFFRGCISISRKK